ncbi:hypothetical protein [Clostridium botulinum]|uniref:hypothetical protein n=1 Tax=Clostridium botulinum TaxID=1491 RepID=UPI00178CFD0B|nr:hypothetical protein [Clostridium botulinum]
MADKEQEVKFTKEQIVNSKQFTVIEIDVLKALLKDEQYSIDEVKKILEKFNKKEVK